MGSHCWNLWFSCSSRHVPKLSYDLHAAALATCCRFAQVWFSLACSKMSVQPHFQPSWRSTSAHSELNLNFSDARVLKCQLFRVITTKLQKDCSHLLHRNRLGPLGFIVVVVKWVQNRGSRLFHWSACGCGRLHKKRLIKQKSAWLKRRALLKRF